MKTSSLIVVGNDQLCSEFPYSSYELVRLGINDAVGECVFDQIRSRLQLEVVLVISGVI
jgi:hypothetical protein